MMLEHLILGAMLVIIGYQAYLAATLANQARKEAQIAADKAREHEELMGSTLEVAREILRHVRR
ncbi:MAG: hypothetical protein ACRERD_16685 [Candidatus Binatia bacterium]